MLLEKSDNLPLDKSLEAHYFKVAVDQGMRVLNAKGSTFLNDAPMISRART
jgi:hypothetical protein